MLKQKKTGCEDAIGGDVPSFGEPLDGGVETYPTIDKRFLDMTRRDIAKTFILVLLVAILGACGFHLRGMDQNGVLADSFRSWKVEGEPGKILEPLQKKFALYGREAIYAGKDGNLKTGKKDMASKPLVGSDPAVLRIVQVSKKKRAGVISSEGVVSEYNLAVEVLFDVRKDTRITSEPIKIVAKGRMQFDTDKALAKSREEDMIWRELYDEAAGMIVDRLRFMDGRDLVEATPELMRAKAKKEASMIDKVDAFDEVDVLPESPMGR